MKLSLQPSLARAQRGYSLIELSIALAILSVVIVAALLGVQRILDNNNANNVIKQVPYAHAGMITATATTTNSFTGLTTEQLARFGNFPPSSIAAGAGDAAVISNPFGGNYVAGANAAAVGTVPIGQGYFFSISGAPASMCTTLVSGLAPIAHSVWVGASAGAVKRTAAPPAAFINAKNGPADGITLAELNTACNTGAGAPQEITLFLTR